MVNKFSQLILLLVLFVMGMVLMVLLTAVLA